MMKGSPFVISEFADPSGEIVYRLYGRVDGECNEIQSLSLGT